MQTHHVEFDKPRTGGLSNRSAQRQARIDSYLDGFRDPILLVGRLFIAAIFIYDATLAVRFADANVAYMQQFGVPGFLLYPAAIFQFVGGLLILVGLYARATALAFAGFCVLTALIFHHEWADLNELVQFGKDFGLAGGYLFLTAAGAGRWSVDHRRRLQK